MEQLKVDYLARGPKGDITFLTLGLEPATIESQAKCPNPKPNTAGHSPGGNTAPLKIFYALLAGYSILSGKE